MAIAYWLSNSYLAFSRSWSMVSVIWLEAFIAVQSCTRVANQGCEYKQCIHTHTEWGAVCFESQYMYGDNAFYCLQRCPSRRITDQHAMRLTASVYYCHAPPKILAVKSRHHRGTLCYVHHHRQNRSWEIWYFRRPSRETLVCRIKFSKKRWRFDWCSESRFLPQI